MLPHSINMIGMPKRMTKIWDGINFKSHSDFHFSCVAGGWTQLPKNSAAELHG